jgi:hypothetical protein
MKRLMQERKTIWSLVVLLLTGCASSQGFDRTAMLEVLYRDALQDQSDQPLIDRGPNLSLPFRLGVFLTDHDFPNRQSVRKIEWLSTDRDLMLRQLTPLQSEQILKDAFVLMDPTLRRENVSGIRQAGARHGADLVLIVDGAAAIDRYNNVYASLYPTLIGAYLAPGTESHALVIATGSLWDVKSEWHSRTQTVEGVSQSVGPAVFVDDTLVMSQAKKAAIHALSESVSEQLRLLKEERPRVKVPSR